MADVLDFLRDYLKIPAVIASSARVMEVIDEIERLRAELAATREERDRARAQMGPDENKFLALYAEQDALRAKLAAQADIHTEIQMRLSDERDAMRALLVRSRAWIVDGKRDFNDELADEIDAALKEDK